MPEYAGVSWILYIIISTLNNNMDNYSYPIDDQILRQFAQQHPIFRIETPSAKDISAFHQKGYILFYLVLKDYSDFALPYR